MTSLARSALFLCALALATVVGLTVAALPGCRMRQHTSRKVGGHAAAWEKPRGAKYALSQSENVFECDVAHAGPVGTLVTSANSGAGTPALMRSARSKSTAWRSLVARRGSANYAEVAGSNPVTVPSLGLIGPRTDSKCLRRPEFANSAARTAQVGRRTQVVTGGESAASLSSHMAVEAVAAVDRAAAKFGSNPAEDAT